MWARDTFSRVLWPPTPPSACWYPDRRPSNVPDYDGRVSVLDFLFGPPLRSDADREERIGVAKGIPIFGLDALSSAAYGPEAALTLLIPLGAAGIAYLFPISISIVILLVIV